MLLANEQMIEEGVNHSLLLNMQTYVETGEGVALRSGFCSGSVVEFSRKKYLLTADHCFGTATSMADVWAKAVTSMNEDNILTVNSGSIMLSMDLDNNKYNFKRFKDDLRLLELSDSQISLDDEDILKISKSDPAKGNKLKIVGYGKGIGPQTLHCTFERDSISGGFPKPIDPSLFLSYPEYKKHFIALNNRLLENLNSDGEMIRIDEGIFDLMTLGARGYANCQLPNGVKAEDMVAMGFSGASVLNEMNEVVGVVSEGDVNLDKNNLHILYSLVKGLNKSFLRVSKDSKMVKNSSELTYLPSIIELFLETIFSDESISILEQNLRIAESEGLVSKDKSDKSKDILRKLRAKSFTKVKFPEIKEVETFKNGESKVTVVENKYIVYNMPELN